MPEIVVPKTLDEAVETLETALADIREDQAKANNGVAKAGKRIRANFQIIAKTSKAARKIVTELTKKEKKAKD